jgi:hypothetical protein
MITIMVMATKKPKACTGKPLRYYDNNTMI